jgi:oligosaccharide reducing-end xylanase
MMKKSVLFLLLLSTFMSARAYKPWTKGAFETGQYRNVFAEMGYTQAAIDAKLKEVFNDVFRGPNKVYFEVGDTMGYVSDIKNHDARTEGMSYGMMIAVQFGEKDIFDRLWRWSKKYMQHKSGNHQGYFAWSCKTDGTRNAEGAASDGELYYITALIFASNRWGNDTGINYKKEAQYILNMIQDREYAPEPRPGFPPMVQEDRPRMHLIDPGTKLITFTPDGFGQRFTDPSYHIPAFYEVWAKWADDGRSDYWNECAAASREFLHKAINETTGLNADMCQYDGSEMQMPRFPGMPQRPQGQKPRRNGSNNFRYDSWRVPMNIALDYEWSCADGDWQRKYGETIQKFFYAQGVDKFVDQYRTDGSLPEEDEILPAGGFRKLRHSIGLVSTIAAASVMCSHKKSKEFVDHLWNAKHEPFEDGYFDAYYDGLLRLFAFMHLSGNYRVITPNTSTVPLVYDVENTGSHYAKPKMAKPDKLPIIHELPDPLEGVSSFADWAKRRSDIGHMIQHYGIGTKPQMKREQVKARMEGDTLFVDVTVGNETLTLKSHIRYPKVGQPPYALMIGTDMIALPRKLFEDRPIATATFTSAQVNDYKQFGKHHDRGEHAFDRLYPQLKDNGAYSEWAWGFSRLIDGLQQLGPEVTKIDTRHIGVTGCSYAGKMALYCGAFDERVALTIAQEPGGGGAAAWRKSHESKEKVEDIDKTDYHWFLESQRENFKGDSVYRLPYDQHELCAMVCPRALLLLGNPDFVWLSDVAMLASAKAAHPVWERFGIGDRMGWSIEGGHGHCQLPESQWPEVQAFIDRFLLGRNVATLVQKQLLPPQQ